MGTTYSITEQFGRNLAELLAQKIEVVFNDFDSTSFVAKVDQAVIGKSYTQRIDVIANALAEHLPSAYMKALKILTSILGDENPNETGMFTHYYWILPIGKYIENYGLNHFEASMDAIAEITKRNTGEYAIRPFIRRYPVEALTRIKMWALSDNFHLRRLASEGLRPKLPWATKLDTFIHNPTLVFEILEMLKEDHVMFVKKSVANHLTDWLKVNKGPTIGLISRWEESNNAHTKWIIKRATRKMP